MRYCIYVILLFIVIPVVAWSEDTAKTTTVSAGQSFNPDISVIGDFLGHYSSNTKADNGYALREVELGFSSYVDPYSRADAFLSIGEEKGEFKLEVEEAYFTFLTLPYNFQMRVGRFRVDLGRVNAQHLHALPWVKYPLMLRTYSGGEGFAGDGVSINWLAPTEHYLEVTYQAFNNTPTTLSNADSGTINQLLHLKNYWDLSDTSTLEVGLSGMRLPPAQDSNRIMVEGLDVIYRWRPTKEGKYHSFMWQAEALAAQKDGLIKEVKSQGMFTAVNYQFDERWFVGTRFDYSELPDDASKQEREYSAYLTFTESEYAFWRLGYSVTKSDIAENNNDKQVFLQLNIGIGPHRAHKY